MKLLTKEECKERGLHNTKIFQSCFPSKRFCYYCMTELKEINENEK